MVIPAATAVASALLEVCCEVAALMRFVLPTFTCETEVLTLPENVIVEIWLGVWFTTGVKPAAEKGPTSVTVAPETVAVYPASPTALATSLACVLGLDVAAVAPLVIVMPFTTTLVTEELLEPLKVIVAFGIGGEVVMTGVTPAADAGPLIVSTLPDDVPL